MATLADKVSVSKDVLASEVENEVVLLNQATGKYFTLDETGTRIWKLIVQKRAVGAGEAGYVGRIRCRTLAA